LLYFSRHIVVCEKSIDKVDGMAKTRVVLPANRARALKYLAKARLVLNGFDHGRFDENDVLESET